MLPDLMVEAALDEAPVPVLRSPSGSSPGAVHAAASFAQVDIGVPIPPAVVQAAAEEWGQPLTHAGLRQNPYPSGLGGSLTGEATTWTSPGAAQAFVAPIAGTNRRRTRAPMLCRRSGVRLGVSLHKVGVE